MRKLFTIYTCFFLFSSLILFTPESFAQESPQYTVAVLDLEANGVSQVEAKTLSEKIRTRISWLINTDTYMNSTETVEYTVIERSQITKILNEFETQSTVCNDVSCAVEFGKMLQADRIIIGSVNLIRKTYYIATRLVDVETGKSLSVSEINYKGSIDGLLRNEINDVPDELILGTPYRDWENSEFIYISGNPEDADVTINRKKIGFTPIQNKMISLGNNSVRIRKIGYEDYREKVRIRKGSPYQLNYTLFPKTRGRTFIKSMYFPGSGQRYAERKGKGYLITLAQLAAIAGVVETTLLSMEAQQDYDDAKDAYYNSTSQNEFNKNYVIMEDKHDEASSANTLQLISAGAALAVYLYNLIDAAITEPKIEEQFTSNSFLIKPQISMDCSSISVCMRF